jgi:hypothetical protein
MSSLIIAPRDHIPTQTRDKRIIHHGNHGI